jgi:hypothetical protein
MPRIPSQEYPAPRPVAPFKAWLHRKYTGNQSVVDWVKYTDEEHFETRATYAEYVVWTWEYPKTWLLNQFTVEQIGRAMEGEWHVFIDGRLPRLLRNRAWRALHTLFSQLFEPTVSDFMEDLFESDAKSGPLEMACFMWWDVSPYWQGSQYAEAIDHEFFLSLCRQSIYSIKPVIQGSALHGLNHNCGLMGAKKLLDEFLSKNLASRPELIEYAQDAKFGRNQ